MIRRATCPTCSLEVAVHDGRLVRHHGTHMRWSGRRWFRTTCRGSGTAVPSETGGCKPGAWCTGVSDPAPASADDAGRAGE